MVTRYFALDGERVSREEAKREHGVNALRLVKNDKGFWSVRDSKHVFISETHNGAGYAMCLVKLLSWQIQERKLHCEVSPDTHYRAMKRAWSEAVEELARTASTAAQSAMEIAAAGMREARQDKMRGMS